MIFSGQLHSFKSGATTSAPHIFLLAVVLQMMEGDARSTIPTTAVTNGDLIHMHAMQQQPAIKPEQLRMLNKHTGKDGVKSGRNQTRDFVSHLPPAHTT